MIELPEAVNLGHQTGKELTGKRISKVITATSPHKFAFFNGDPEEYPALLTGKKILSTIGHGMFVDLCCEADTKLSFSEGTNIRYSVPGEAHPTKHQLLIEFEDSSFITFSVAMYGGILAFKGELDNKYYQGSLQSISPLDEAFDENTFDEILRGVTKDLSLKALLATEQRIPGLGNGVLQDILFNAGMHPRRKISSVGDFQLSELLHSLKVTLDRMATQGGRDTEKDLYASNGGYKTLLSKNSYKNPCPICGDSIVKQPYMGGAIYFCPTCQPLHK